MFRLTALFSTLRRYPVQFGQVAVQHDLLAPHQQYPSLDRFAGSTSRFCHRRRLPFSWACLPASFVVLHQPQPEGLPDPIH